MKLLTVITVAAALAVGLSVNPPGSQSFFAEAQAKGKKKAKAAKKRPGSCGTYMYWSKGKCVDARVTPVKK